MADKKAPKPHPSWLEEHFGLALIMFFIIIFTMWVLNGGPNKPETKSGLFESPTTQGEGYGPVKK